MRSTPGSAQSVPRRRLLALDRLEQRLEVPLAEAPRAVALDDLEEQRRPVLDRLGEDLQHVAFVVAVDEDAELGQLVAGPPRSCRRGRAASRNRPAARAGTRRRWPHGADGVDDVVGGHGDVLHAGAAVELQVLLDLRPPPRLGRLVDRELDPARAVLHHLRHQGRVLGADVLVVEVDELREAEHVARRTRPTRSSCLPRRCRRCGRSPCRPTGWNVRGL